MWFSSENTEYFCEMFELFMVLCDSYMNVYLFFGTEYFRE